jgi:hypothetical protein
MTRDPISSTVILKISPTKRPEYFEKLPPLDNITRPTAILSDENTDMTVSVDTVRLLLILFKNNAKNIAKIRIAILVLVIPSRVPIANPVRAE